MKRKYRAGIVCCLALCLLLAACSDMPPEPESSDSTSSAVTSTATVESEPVSGEAPSSGTADSSSGLASSQSTPSTAPVSSAESSQPDVSSNPANSSAPSSEASSMCALPPASSKPQPVSSAPVISSEPPAPPPVSSEAPASSEAPVSSTEEIRWPSDATDLDREYYSNDRYIDETELDAMIADATAYSEGLGMLWNDELTKNNAGFENPQNTRDAYLNVHGGLLNQANKLYREIKDDLAEVGPVECFKIYKEEFQEGYWLVYYLYG